MLALPQVQGNPSPFPLGLLIIFTALQSFSIVVVITALQSLYAESP